MSGLLPSWHGGGKTVSSSADGRQARRRSMTFFEEGICSSYAQDPLQNMNIEALVVLDGELNKQDVVDLLRERLLAFDRFRSKIVRTEQGKYFFQEMEISDGIMDRIVQEKNLRQGTWQELLEYMGEVLFAPWLEELPRWDVHLLHNFKDEGKVMTAILFRFDHSLGDGFALSKVLLSLTDHSPEQQEKMLQTKRRERKQERFFQEGRGTCGKLLSSVFNMLFSHVQQFAYILRGLWMAIVEMELSDSRSILSVRSADPKVKEMRISRVHSLEKVKKIARLEHNSTVNDVLMAIVSGALRRFLQLNEDPVLFSTSRLSMRTIRAIMVASLRGTKHTVRSLFSNDITFLPVDIPVMEPGAALLLLLISDPPSKSFAGDSRR
eukprot:762056-Hanusia_phi.AAC.2